MGEVVRLQSRTAIYKNKSVVPSKEPTFTLKAAPPPEHTKDEPAGRY